MSCAVAACTPSDDLTGLQTHRSPDAGDTANGGSGAQAGAANGNANSTTTLPLEPDGSDNNAGGANTDSSGGKPNNAGGSGENDAGIVAEPADSGGSGGDAGDPTDAGTMPGAGSDPSSGGSGGAGGSSATDESGGTSTGGNSGGGGNSADGGRGGGSGGGGGGSGAVVDECPDDDDKTEPGDCGCGAPDTDTDSDATPDCDDECPDDEDKTEPGDCGCGKAEDPACAVLLSSLVHRYDFSGSGSVATDRIGSADGSVVGGRIAAGRLALAGGTSGEYVDLPNGIISELTDATLEVWVTWNTLATWVRIFDFGSSTGGEDTPDLGVTYLFLTPRGTNSSGKLSTSITLDGVDNETFLPGNLALSTGTEYHLAISVASGDTLTLYANGELEASADITISLSELDDVNNWLGRSQFGQDAGFDGSINEFRIYDAALTPDEIAYSFSEGPNSELFAQ